MTRWATQLLAIFLLPACLGIASCQALAQIQPETQIQQGGQIQENSGPHLAQFFEKEIRPLLVEHCYECHSANQQKGHLSLDSLQGMLIGGETGPAVVPGEPEQSLLISAIRHESFEMPPAGKLPDSAIDRLTEWVRLGAHWPGADSSAPLRKRSSQEFTEEDRAWWAIQPLSRAEPPQPANQDWARNEIDLYVLQEMQANGLTPAPEADRVTLIRRLYFDLLGLPPRPEEIRAFVESDDPDAWPKLVDELLERPQYGERWARHWMDLVRYADSDGYRIDHYRPSAWRYRDYVIQSLNADKPYTRFVQEQLAGDEMFPEDLDAQTATGYLRHWIYEYNNRDVRGQWDIIVNEVTDTTADVFLGLGLQCARCHDHKFDPLLQKDYFRLRACFEAIYPDDRVIATSENLEAHRQQAAVWEAATGDLRDQLQSMRRPVEDTARNEAVSRFPEEIQSLIAKPESERTSQEQQIVALAWRQVLYEFERLDDRFKNEKKEQLLAVRRELAKFDHLKPATLPVIMAIRDVGSQAPITMIPKKKIETEPGIPELLKNQVPFSVIPRSNSTGRRSALARWITASENSLTHRVIVNRLWQYHFGRGLAANGSDFGRLGGPPTHPDLLDWLVSRFIRENTQFKPIHRLILNSATWRQASHHPQLDEYQQTDPANRYYWRSNTRRLDAEQIRDAILAASGRLNLTIGGEGVMSDSNRRSIYLRFMRNERDSLLDVFDLPLFFNSSASRDSTTSPVQALMLFNSETMLRHATSLAQRVTSEALLLNSPDEEARVRRLWTIAFGEEPDSHELHDALSFLEQQSERIAQEQNQIISNSVPIGRIPYRDGQSLLIQPDLKSPPLLGPKTLATESTALTVEVFFQVRSVYETGAVRTLVSQWNGDSQTPGWAFGVTGMGSRRKPQTLVFQLYGHNSDGKLVEAALFSDQHIELNKPYYAAVTFEPARAIAAGGELSDSAAAGQMVGHVNFYLKDLSNADEPLLTAKVEHGIVGGYRNDLPLSVGGKAQSKETSFDGLIDDIRVSTSVLSPSELVYSREGVHPSTVGYWRFEATPGILKDSSGHAFDLTPAIGERVLLSPSEAAFEDLCHSVLNSSRFLYVD